jgi:histone acetyltransferase (RNA polymerase elongator complex component)
MKHYNIPIFIPHLGCPFNCIFCNQKRIASLVPAPDPDLVLDMVQSALKSLPVLSQGREIEVAYYGGSFTALDQDLQEKYLLYGGRSDYNSCNDDIQSLSKQHQIDPCSISRRSSSLPEAMVSRVRCKTNSIWDRTCSAY